MQNLSTTASSRRSYSSPSGDSSSASDDEGVSTGAASPSGGIRPLHDNVWDARYLRKWENPQNGGWIVWVEMDRYQTMSIDSSRALIHRLMRFILMTLIVRCFGGHVVRKPS
ncbi:hypothetical protein QAD02_004555 [Eretmocerus hayati]|uniref:Uncharacterized protein n=1 Tax=Eretmocerus hayati TaxID=131215 RepID=A0ACC2NR58_9HYME|nr:hypothetical protein QAD02_004555 [Eretmocerus hayati]